METCRHVALGYTHEGQIRGRWENMDEKGDEESHMYSLVPCICTVITLDAIT